MKKLGIQLERVVFIVVIFGMLLLPFVKADRSGQGVSLQENRNLTGGASLFVEGHLNEGFPAEYEAWLADHIGYRTQLINLNAWKDYYWFHKMPDSSIYQLGQDGHINYVTSEVIKDFSHTNKRSQNEVESIGLSYQYLSDWARQNGAQFYVVQCTDKHTIYPEKFVPRVNQIGDTSKTDQVMKYLDKNTDVSHVYMKDVMLAGKEQCDVYSKWGDPTHWTYRGAYLGYLSVMDMINQNNADSPYYVLQESDYDIQKQDIGITFYDKIHMTDEQDIFYLKNPKAVQQEDKTPMGYYGEFPDHSRWINTEAGNDKKLLILGDSYFNNFIVDDFAESFGETWMIWEDYIDGISDIMQMYHPDVIICEAAERADRSGLVTGTVYHLQAGE